MQRYTVFVRSGGKLSDHSTAIVCSYSRLLHEAVSTFGQTLRDMDTEFWSDPSLTLWATDEDGRTVLSLDANGLSVEPKPH